MSKTIIHHGKHTSVSYVYRSLPRKHARRSVARTTFLISAKETVFTQANDWVQIGLQPVTVVSTAVQAEEIVGNRKAVAAAGRLVCSSAGRSAKMTRPTVPIAVAVLARMDFRRSGISQSRVAVLFRALWAPEAVVVAEIADRVEQA